MQAAGLPVLYPGTLIKLEYCIVDDVYCEVSPNAHQKIQTVMAFAGIQVSRLPSPAVSVSLRLRCGVLHAPCDA